MPSRSVPFGVKPRTWSATSSPRKPSMGSPASNPYAPTPRACWIPAANTGVLKTVSTTFATSPLMKIARASAVAQAPRSWPPFAISPYRFSASPELATSPQHFAAVLVRAIPSSFASSGCDFDVAVIGPPGYFDGVRVRIGARNEAARDVLARIVKIPGGPKFAWGITSLAELRRVGVEAIVPGIGIQLLELHWPKQ